jgi:hypothetical protein
MASPVSYLAPEVEAKILQLLTPVFYSHILSPEIQQDKEAELLEIDISFAEYLTETTTAKKYRHLSRNSVCGICTK